MKTKVSPKEDGKLEKDGNLPLIVGALSEMIKRIIRPDCDEITAEKFEHLRAISIFFTTRTFYNDDFHTVFGLSDYGYVEPADGRPSFELTFRAKPSRKEFEEQHEWMISKHPDEWDKIKNYEYDGLFEVEVEISFSVNDWKKFFPEEPKVVE